ncbi:DUF3307 domain-containing protein [Autumnicola musiva]|uniref:DUF3307 domain-containing protein n=1 Tax=Autumnicola musiva TaxID=3075589 RepID=A0ABU3D5X2_9FLAO|nr:DUF3307 domain-containing protein [Zunongwangia sp. F117]MDT0676899.1 DUF3307 domain-containing protein [Zunongwangia sp. F117]
MIAVLVLLQLLLAHILTDFVFQPTKWVLHKRKYKATSKYLYIHSFIAGLLTYILLQQWHLWYVALFIALTHFFIDYWKLMHNKDNLQVFLLDQLFHIIIILLVWVYLSNEYDQVLPMVVSFVSSPSALAIIIGYLLVIFPVGFIVGKSTEGWHNELLEEGKSVSLEAAGRYIGIFERILVLTFILTNNFSAIGFLIAAKSILRFSDKSEAGARKQTEYVLIGTLMSFAITIITGLLIRHIFF